MSSRLSTRRAVIPDFAPGCQPYILPDSGIGEGRLTLGDISVIVPQELFAPERLKSLKDPVPDPTTSDGTNDLVF
jgi:hypothetical protein